MADQNNHPEEQERVVIRDNRKIDREGAGATAGAGAGGAAAATSGAGAGPVGEPAVENEVPMVEASLLDERTADLQRLQAEYANYRKRADRERQAAGDLAIAATLGQFLPVLDDLDRARAHGDLSGALKAVADKLDDTFRHLGLEPFGEAGDPFDPSIHEAVTHDESDEVGVPTCTIVMRPGYRHKDRLVRAAMVGVTDPLNPTPPTAPTSATASATAENESEAGDDATSEGDPAADNS